MQDVCLVTKFKQESSLKSSSLFFLFILCLLDIGTYFSKCRGGICICQANSVCEVHTGTFRSHLSILCQTWAGCFLLTGRRLQMEKVSGAKGVRAHCDRAALEDMSCN